jgi:hypothetical protein
LGRFGAFWGVLGLLKKELNSFIGDLYWGLIFIVAAWELNKLGIERQTRRQIYWGFKKNGIIVAFKLNNPFLPYNFENIRKKKIKIVKNMVLNWNRHAFI